MTTQLVPETKTTTMKIMGCKIVQGNYGDQIKCSVWWEHFENTTWVKYPEVIWIDPEMCPPDLKPNSNTVGDMDPDEKGGETAERARELLDNGVEIGDNTFPLKVYTVKVKRGAKKKQGNEYMRGNEPSHYFWKIEKFREDGASEDQKQTEGTESNTTTKTGKPYKSTHVEQTVSDGGSRSNNEILLAIATMMAPKIQSIYQDISQAVGAEGFNSSGIAIESQRLYKENVYPTIEAEIISLYRTFSKLQ